MMNRSIVLLLSLVSLVGLGACSASVPSDRPVVVTEPVLADPLWLPIGRSVEDRPIEAMSIGDAPTRVLLIGSIHGDETEGLSLLDAFLRDLSSLEIADDIALRVVRDMNPDGTSRSTRGNARGVDLNRNWPATNFRGARRHGARALSEPETAAVHATMLAFRPHLVVVFHSTRRGPFVNYDGPSKAERAAEAWAQTLGWRTVGDMGYPTPGSLGSLAGVDMRLPVLTIEFKKGSPAPSSPRVADAFANAVRSMELRFATPGVGR